MSRLDYVTIAIIVVCAVALGFIIWRTVGKSKESTEAQTGTENTLQDYDYDYYEDTTQILPPTEDYVDETALEPVAPATQPTRPAEMDDRPTATTTRSEGSFLVLAGSFKVKTNAENEAQRLRGMGYSSASAEIFDRGAFAVVLVDRFNSVGEARQLVQELKGKGVEAYVQERRN